MQAVSYEILRLLSGDGARRLMVFETFLDEGGTHGGAGQLGVGGYFGYHDQWKEFLKEWGNPDFHSHERESEELKPRMLAAIERNRLIGLVCTIDPRKYKQLAGPIFQSTMGNAYAVCTFACLLNLNTAFPEDKFAFVIEDGQPNSEWVLRMILAMQNSPEWGHSIAGAMLAKKRDSVQLQAADFMAHSFATRHPRWLPEIKKLPILEAHIGEERLISLSEEARRLVREHRNQKLKARRAERNEKEK